MEQNVTIMTVLEELRDFRAENNKRWEQNDKRWEENERRWDENDKHWEQNDKRWEENERRWEKNEKRWEANDKKIDSIDKRVSRLEEGRKSDKREIVEVLKKKKKSIDKQFIEIKDYLAIQIDKMNAALIANEAEHKQFREDIKNLTKRSDFQNYRITSLEEWKENFEDDVIGVC